MDIEKIDHILKKNDYKHSAIISIMQDVQDIENYLPEETLRYISDKLELNLTRIFDVATFYKAFSLVPRGCHRIKVCCGTACHLAGAERNLDQIKRSLHIKEDETTDDCMFSLETVNCLGTCALAPVVMVDDDYHDAVSPGKIKKIILAYCSESKRSAVEKD